MNVRTLCVVSLLGCASLAPSVRAQAAEATSTASAPAAKSAADRDYDALWADFRENAPEGIEHPSQAYSQWMDKKLQSFATAARAFGEKYPNDPRRYEGWVQSSFTGPSFLTGFNPETGKGIPDQAAVVAYRAEQVRLLQIVIEAEDATPRHRGGAFFALLTDASTVARLKGEKFDVTQFRPLLDRVLAKHPDEGAVRLVEMYESRLRQQSAPEADAFLASVKANPVLGAAIEKAEANRKAEAEKQAAAQKVAAAEIGSIKFTAADGREVDIAKLRGRVVLVDFWATWCGPCVAELPNVKKVYAAYHDKGFEIVGITLENPNATPKDTPEKTAAKLEAAKKKMLEFTVKNEMPWPQYFDGKWWKNDYAVKFGIHAIPAMFLLDKEGKIAATEARGEKLETEVKRLLGL